MKYFVYILAAGLFASLLGVGFALLVAEVSPELIMDLFPRSEKSNHHRYAAAVGMIWGLFLGAAVMAFSLLLTTLQKLKRHSNDR